LARRARLRFFPALTFLRLRTRCVCSDGETMGCLLHRTRAFSGSAGAAPDRGANIRNWALGVK
jgi:hypothetical protein